MSPDIRDMLQGAAPDPTRPLDIGYVRGRARRLRAFSLAIAPLLLLTLGTASYLTWNFGISSSSSNQNPAGDSADPYATEDSVQAAVVAVKAAAAADLFKRDPYMLSYVDTKEKDGSWTSKFKVHLCRGIDDCAPGGFLEIEIEANKDGGFQLSSARGDIDDATRKRMEGYQVESVDPYPTSRLLSYRFEPRSSESYIAPIAFLWTGPIPFEGFVRCDQRITDVNGEVILEHQGWTRTPSEESDRVSEDSNVIFMSETEPAELTYACESFQEHLLDTPQEPSPQDASGYLLEVQQVTYLTPYGAGEPIMSTSHSHKEGSVTVAFYPSWMNDEFPGARACRIELLGENGAELGTWVDDDFTMTVPNSGRPLVIDISTDRVPHKVRAYCTGPRRDDPGGYYKISEVKIDSRSGARVRVSFLARWVGTSKQGQNVCEISLLTENGWILATDRYGFASEHTGQFESHAEIEYPASSPDPAFATVQCQPMGPTGYGN